MFWGQRVGTRTQYALPTDWIISSPLIHPVSKFGFKFKCIPKHLLNFSFFLDVTHQGYKKKKDISLPLGGLGMTKIGEVQKELFTKKILGTFLMNLKEPKLQIRV